MWRIVVLNDIWKSKTGLFISNDSCFYSALLIYVRYHVEYAISVTLGKGIF